MENTLKSADAEHGGFPTEETDEEFAAKVAFKTWSEGTRVFFGYPSRASYVDLLPKDKKQAVENACAGGDARELRAYETRAASLARKWSGMSIEEVQAEFDAL